MRINSDEFITKAISNLSNGNRKDVKEMFTKLTKMEAAYMAINIYQELEMYDQGCTSTEFFNLLVAWAKGGDR